MNEQNNRKNVINGLLYMKRQYLEGTEEDQTIDNAIALLKEQEPTKPTLEYALSGQHMWCCGNCGTTLFFKLRAQTDDENEKSHYLFCHYCGRAVKWE